MQNVVINITEAPTPAVTVNVTDTPQQVDITIAQGGGGADPATQAQVDAGIIANKYVAPLTFENAAKWATKFDNPTGAVSDYLDGTGAPQPFPSIPPPSPVDSVNGYTGIVVLGASDVGADIAGSAATAESNANTYTDNAIAALPPIPPALTAGTNISIVGNAINNTAPDQVVSLTAGTGIGVSGTYPNFTISNTAPADIIKATASGTDTYTATIAGVTSYTDGDVYLIRFTNGNTTAATLNINALGARTLYRNNDGALIGGDIWAGAEMLCVYNSTLNGFQAIGTSPNSLFAYVTNAEAVAITKGQVVYSFGAQGDRLTVKLANNTSDATSARTLGVVYSDSIGANQKGFILVQGEMHNLSILPATTYSNGDILYLGATNGSITKTKPFAPNHLVYVATVITASNGNAGRMYVRVQNGYELDELHDVSAQTPANNDGLFYNSVTGLWTARAGTKSDVGLGNVDNTSDANKPISNATQTALNAKENTITTLTIAKGGTNSSTALNNNRVMRSSAGAIVEAAAITASRALKSDANGIPTHFDTATEPSLTELTYVKGVTSAIQTQINGKENTITAGGTLQYFRGDKTFQNYLVVATDGALYTNTGNTNLNRVLSILIPANTYTANSIVYYKILSTKTLSNGSYSVRTFIHTSAGVGGTQMSLSSSSAATQLVMGLERTFQVQVANGTGNGTRGLTGTQNALTEMSAAAWTVQTSAIDWTQTQYLNIFLQNGSALDTSAINAVVLYRF